MAEFNTIFDRGTLPPPTYDNYENTINVNCGEDAIPRTITFQGIGDFRLGTNFNSNYDPAKDIIIENFTDVTTYSDTNGGPEIINTSVISSQLTYNGTVATLPLTIPLADLSLLGFQVNGAEIQCASTKFDNKRIRKITYYISDSNDQYGVLKESVLTVLGVS